MEAVLEYVHATRIVAVQLVLGTTTSAAIATWRRAGTGVPAITTVGVVAIEVTADSAATMPTRALHVGLASRRGVGCDFRRAAVVDANWLAARAGGCRRRVTVTRSITNWCDLGRVARRRA